MYSIKLHFPTSNLFLKIFSTEPDPLVFFFETAVVQKAQKRGLSFRDKVNQGFTPHVDLLYLCDTPITVEH